MDVETTTVSITGVPVETLRLLRADAVRNGYSASDAGVMRYCLMSVARDARAAGATYDTGSVDSPDET